MESPIRLCLSRCGKCSNISMACGLEAHAESPSRKGRKAGTCLPTGSKGSKAAGLKPPSRLNLPKVVMKLEDVSRAIPNVMNIPDVGGEFTKSRARRTIWCRRIGCCGACKVDDETTAVFMDPFYRNL